MPKEVYVVTAKVYDELRRQISFNKMVTLFCVLGTVYILKAEKRITALNNEIEQLKNQKGE